MWFDLLTCALCSSIENEEQKQKLFLPTKRRSVSGSCLKHLWNASFFDLYEEDNSAWKQQLIEHKLFQKITCKSEKDFWFDSQLGHTKDF